MHNLLIFELDGGAWSAIEPMLARGLLPHLAGLIRRGIRGILHAIPPLVSPALWTTIYTGQPRERHQVLTFDATSQEVRYRRLWDIAHDHGLSCGVCGSLVTWPPYDVGGFMIPDIMARDSQTIPPRFAPLQDLALNYPRNQQRTGYGLSSYIRHAVGLNRARIRGRTMLALAREALGAKLRRRSYHDTYWRYVLLLQQLYTDAFLQLYRTYHPRLATYHFHAVDTISHRYWRDLSNEQSDEQEALSAAYQAADRALGAMLKLAGPDTTVLLISDRGFQTLSEERSWYIARLPRLIQMLGLENAATPTRLGKQHFLYFRDASRAAATGETLRASTFKETGAPLLPRVVVRDTSLFFLPPKVRGDGLTVAIPGRAEVPFEELFTDTGHTETGTHHPEGILILAGPPVRQGIELEASSLDVTPTALKLLDLPVARDMPGRVWTEAMREAFLRRSPITFVDTYAREAEGKTEDEIDGKDAEVLYRRLHDLGYL